MNENPFAPYSKPFEALRAVVRFGPGLVEYPSDFLPLLFVAERTASWQKAADAVSLRQFVAGIRRKDGVAIRSGCGLRLTALKQALARLEKRGLLIRERRHNKRSAAVSTEHRLNWRRVAEMIESAVIPLAVKRPPSWPRDGHLPGRDAATPLAVKRPHSKDSYSKDLNSKPASQPPCSNVTPETATAQETAGRQAELLKLLTECWPHLPNVPGPKLLERIGVTLGDCPRERFGELLAKRRRAARSFGLALDVAHDARKRWESDAAQEKQAAEIEHPRENARKLQQMEDLLADPNTPAEIRPEIEQWRDELRSEINAPTEPKHAGWK